MGLTGGAHIACFVEFRLKNQTNDLCFWKRVEKIQAAHPVAAAKTPGVRNGGHQYVLLRFDSDPHLLEVNGVDRCRIACRVVHHEARAALRRPSPSVTSTVAYTGASSLTPRC